MEPNLHWFQCADCDTAWRAPEATPCWFCGLPPTASKVLIVRSSCSTPDVALNFTFPG